MATTTATPTTATPTTAKTTAEQKAQQKQDMQVLGLKAAGATWKFIAIEMGWGWNGANMDGGRAKRAYLRAVKREVVAAEVVLPKTLMTKLAAAQKAKTSPKVTVDAKAKKTLAKVAKAAKPEFTTTGIPLNDEAVKIAQAS